MGRYCRHNKNLTTNARCLGTHSTNKNMIASQNGFNLKYSEDSPTESQISEVSGCAILEFGAPWCGHCQAAAPAVKEVLSELELPHIKVFDGKGKKLGRVFGVRLWPTIILLSDGQEIARLVRPTHTHEIKGLLTNIK